MNGHRKLPHLQKKVWFIQYCKKKKNYIRKINRLVWSKSVPTYRGTYPHTIWGSFACGAPVFMHRLFPVGVNILVPFICRRLDYIIYIYKYINNHWFTHCLLCTFYTYYLGLTHLYPFPVCIVLSIFIWFVFSIQSWWNNI